MAPPAEAQGAPTATRSLWRRLMLDAESMAPAGLQTVQREQLERQMLELLMRGISQVQLTSSVIGPALVAVLTLPHIGAWRSVGPALLLFLLGAERLIVIRRFQRANNEGALDTRRRARALVVRTGLSVTVIVVWIHFVVQSGNSVLMSQVLALVAVLATGATWQYCSWPPAVWTAITPLLLGISILFALTGDTGHMVEAAFAFILWFVLVLASLRFARTLHENTLQRLRNEELVHELRQKSVQAEAANVARSRFFAAANHDLRQPLQAMGLYLSVLEAGKPDAATLARLNQCVQALDGLLGGLLNLSRLESGQLAPELRPFAMQPLLEHLATLYAAVAQDKGLQFRVRPTTAWVQSDPMLLERALSNLLSNAFRYTQAGGVLLAVRTAHDEVRVRVFDTGVGIPADAHDAVFDEFVQLGNPERDPDRGHGLGLPTVRRIAQLMGCSLHLRSQPGHGSCFTIRVPRAQPQTDASLSEPTQVRGQLQGRVLVVEDNAMVRDALGRLLGGWGMTVVAVPDGAQAMQAMRRAPFDVVLCDWRLPGGADGVTVLRHARRVLPGLSLGLLLTGEDTRELQGLDLEFPLLRKPVRPLRLRALLGQLVPPPGQCDEY